MQIADSSPCVCVGGCSERGTSVNPLRAYRRVDLGSPCGIALGGLCVGSGDSERRCVIDV